MALNQKLIDGINKGDDQNINDLAIQIVELIEKNPQNFTRNEEIILEDIREIVWEE